MYCWAKPHPSMLLNWYALFHLMWLLILVVQDKMCHRNVRNKQNFCPNEILSTLVAHEKIPTGPHLKDSETFRWLTAQSTGKMLQSMVSGKWGEIYDFFFFFFWQLLKSFKRKSFKSRIYLFLNPLKERGSSVRHFHQGHWNQRLPWPHNFTGYKVLLAFLTLALKSKSNTGCQKDRMPLKCWEFGTLHVSHKNVSLPSLANRNL